MGVWAQRAALLLGGAGIAALVVVIAALFPYFRDDAALDRIVREVALDWRDFGEAKAAERLAYELDHRRIGAWVGDDDCSLVDGDDGRAVRCAWSVDVVVPFVERRITLSFASDAPVPGS